VDAVASLKARATQAAALHRQAAATAAAAAIALDATRPAPADQREQHELAERMRAAAGVLVPGWLGAPLDAQSEDAPLGGPGLPGFVRIGTAQPLDDARFPAVVPLLGTGHLSVDADARDPRVAGLVRAMLLRLLAAAPAGSLLVRAVDGAAPGATFAGFAPLADAGLMPPPATDRLGLLAVVAEAEQWVRSARPATARHHRRHRALLVVIASLPELTEAAELARIGALAQAGPAAGLHMIVAGWPPPPLTAETTQPPLEHATMIALRNPYALVSDPPGASFGVPSPYLAATGLNSPVFVDEDPPARLVDRVCAELAAQFDPHSRLTLSDLLPDGADSLWSDDAADGLVTTVGHADDRAVTLQFNDLTPHWMIGGRPGGGRTSFLVNVLYGLCTRYPPTDLTLYLLDFAERPALAGVFAPSERDGAWLPHARAIGMAADQEYGLAVLRELDAELARRGAIFERAGVTRFADLTQRHRVPRILCVIDEFQGLLGSDDRLATEAAARLESLARKGRSYGLHLVLVGQPAAGSEALRATREAVFGQFPVRVALPGGGDVLEPTNDAAAGLPLGTAVVNTAGGLGGPRGATRGHERVVRFPDARAEAGALRAWRQRLWERGAVGAEPPTVFARHAYQHLADDPAYRAALGGNRTRPAALVGRTVDAGLSTAAVPLDPSPDRHLIVFGSAATGADVLAAAARSVAAHHGPRTTRFVVASLVAAADGPAHTLAADLAERQEVETVDVADLAKALDTGQPGYLVVFGMDAVGPDLLPPELLRALLRDGPGRGVHLLSWWWAPRRFSDVVAGGDVESRPGMVFLDVPAREVSLVLGHPVDWQPRPNRALLYDPRADRTTVIVPFTGAGGMA
jgi:hypothetical protein